MLPNSISVNIPNQGAAQLSLNPGSPPSYSGFDNVGTGIAVNYDEGLGGWNLFHEDIDVGVLPGGPDDPPVGDFGEGYTTETEEGSGQSGTEKNTAVVPVSFKASGFAALFVTEAPEVRFDDVLCCALEGDGPWAISLDSRYVEVCEMGTIRVAGWSSEEPVALATSVVAGVLHLAPVADSRRQWWQRVLGLKAPQWTQKSPFCLVVRVRLTGIRKGFRGLRFPSRSKAEFLANEAFLKTYYGAYKEEKEGGI